MINNFQLQKLGKIFITIAVGIFFSYMFLPDQPLTSSDDFSTYLGSILGAYDQKFLVNDFFVEANKNFGPRFYYAKIVGLFIDSSSINSGLLLFHLFAKVGLCISTLLLLKTLFPTNSGLLIFTLFGIFLIPGPYIGQHGMFPQRPGIMPMNLSIPFAIAGLGYLVARKPIHTAFYCLLASLFHPNIGVVHGIIFLLSGLVSSIALRKKMDTSIFIKRHLIALFLFLLFVFPLWLLPYLLQKQVLSNFEYVNIVAYLRAPHHLLLSNTSTKDLFDIFYFTISSLFSIYLYKLLYKVDRFRVAVITLIFLSTPILFFAGYYLIEIEKHKIGVALYPARYIELFRYIGIVLLSGITVKLIKSKNTFVYGLCLIVAACCSYKHLALVSAIITIIFTYNPITKLQTLNRKQIFVISVLIFSLFYTKLPWTNPLYLLSFFAFALFFYILPKKPIIPIVVSFISALFFTFGVVTKGNFIFNNFIHSWFEKRPLAKRITYNPYNTNLGRVAKMVSKDTAKNSLFIVPPKHGHFRILSGRSILVDFKSIPFQSHAVDEWYNRLKDAYGPLSGKGWVLRKNTINSYKKISNEKLKFLKDKYKLNYALLYRKTKTSFPVIGEFDNLKLVYLGKSTKLNSFDDKHLDS